MIRNLRTLGLAVAALLAMSVTQSSTAHAAFLTPELAEGSPVTLTGSQAAVNVFTFNGKEYTCTGATLHGTINGAVEEATLAPTYTVCHVIFGFTFNVNISTNGCKFTLTDLTTTGLTPSPPEPEWRGYMDVAGCNAGQGITLSVPAAGCSITVNNQGPRGTVDYENVAGTNPMHINIKWTVAELSFTSTGGLCGPSGTIGTYIGSSTIKADANGHQAGITVTH